MTSIIKVDDVQNQPGTNIINKCSTTITLGQSGDTVAIASGATTCGMGRTGTVDWDTTAKVTGDSPVTGVSGSGYFMNTTAGAITINLPAGSAGSIVSLADYAATWQTNNLTVTPNGTDKIGSVNNSAILDTEGQSVTFVYVDSTQGWINTMDSTSNIRSVSFITATGGTPCAGQTTGDYKYHTFTGPGSFCVSSLSNIPASNSVDWLVVAGGAGGGSTIGGGGGGAGGYRESPGTATGCYTVSPLGAAPAAAITVTASAYPITVGGGGTAQPSPVDDGNPSVFSTYTSAGGGSQGTVGGSGGGQGHRGGAGGAGNDPPTSPPQGQPGGCAPGPDGWAGSGGGGAISAGGDSSGANSGAGGTGGGGATSSINATPTARGGGAGGGAFTQGGGLQPGGAGGAGGGGDGAPSGPGPGGGGCSTAGTVNTGGGGGGANYRGDSGQNPASNGGSGVVILRYKYQ